MNKFFRGLLELAFGSDYGPYRIGPDPQPKVTYIKDGVVLGKAHTLTEARDNLAKDEMHD